MLYRRQISYKVGVFLDSSEGDVSFHNMTDGPHIFSSPPTSFSGTLFPYFILRSGNVSLTICSVVSEPEGLPVPPNNSSLEEPENSQGRGSAQAQVLMVLPQGSNVHYSSGNLRLCPHRALSLPRLFTVALLGATDFLWQKPLR